MSRDLEGTKTEVNLMKAFAGEAMARNRYTYFAKIAKEEGYEQICGFFLETADNEKEHAKRFFQFLGKDNIPVEISDVAYPTGLSDTQTNLENAILGEHDENTRLYPEFAKIAREEGFESIAACFEAVVYAERAHERRYIALLDSIRNDTVFKRDYPVTWKCRNCGYSTESSQAPFACPACLHPRAYFEVNCSDY